MMQREELWFLRLKAVERPVETSLEELSEAVQIYLTKLSGDIDSEQSDQLKRLCNYWNITPQWLAEWRKIHDQLQAKGESAKLTNWLKHPVRPRNLVREGDADPNCPSVAS